MTLKKAEGRILELEAALRPFTFPATPDHFRSGDPTTMVSVLIHEPDVVEARRVLPFVATGERRSALR